MVTALYAPYVTLRSEDIELDNWQAVIGDDCFSVSEYLASWTKGTDIALVRHFNSTPDELCKALGLPHDATLGLSVVLFNNEAKLRELLFFKPLAEALSEPVTVLIDGSSVGNENEIVTSLILIDSGTEPAVGAAFRKGSELFRDAEPLKSGENESGFPTAIVDFQVLPYHDLASWHLETSTELDALFSSVYQLLINENDKALVKAIESEKPTKEQRALLDQMTVGVIEIMLEIAFSQWDELMDSDRVFEESTVGEALKNLLEISEAKVPMQFNRPEDSSRRRSYYAGVARKLNAGRTF